MHWEEIENRARGRIGRTLCGKWTLDALLGVGGTSSVYAATHRNGAPLAIKVLHPSVSAIPEVRARFLREGYLANRVRHPAIVGVLDDAVDEVEGIAFLVMERVDGVSLLERSIDGLFDEDQLLDVAAQTLAALVVAHASGVIHRDLKPENLLVDTSGAVRILDFGIARLLDAGDDVSGATVMGTICGTPGFLAPEQARGDRDAITARTDLFALGATLFALASGRPPHLEANEQQELLRAASQQAPGVREFAPRLSDEVASLIDRALRFASAERWPSATEMLREVRRIRLARGFSRRTLALQVASSPSSMPPPPPISQPPCAAGPRERHSDAMHEAPTLADSCGAIAVEAPAVPAPRRGDRTLGGRRGGALTRARALGSIAATACALLAFGRVATSARSAVQLAPAAANARIAAIVPVPKLSPILGAGRMPVAPVAPVAPLAPIAASSAAPATAQPSPRARALAAVSSSSSSRRPAVGAPAPARARPAPAPASSVAASAVELRSDRLEVASEVVPGYRESPY
jgi:serine/threonine-protein kinase